MKKISIICLLLICSIAFSQEKEDKKDSDINPFSIGVKIGIPNIVGVDIEYVTPIFDNRLAFFVDYSAFKVSPDDAEVKIKHFEFGTNIYFNNKGRGLYGSVSYSKLNLDGTYTDADTVNGTIYQGVATGDVDINTTNIKLGAKLGKKFYFRIELGYGFGDMPKVVEVTGTELGTGTTETDFVEIPDIPGISDNGLFIGNIGFGISF